MALDLAVTWGVYLVVTFGIVLSAGSLDDAALAALSVATFLLLLVGGPIAVETLSHGRSLGKLACGLRVVRDDGGPIRFRHALVRGAVGVVEILISFGVIACFASLVSARGRRIGDVLAGTLVVRERVPAARMAVSPPPPPWLAGRFSSLDLSAVPDDLWLAVRQYLTRMGQLDQGVGRAMAERLAGDLARLTGAPAPHGVPPAAYLAAVIHERQARDARRAFGPHAGQGLTGQPPVGQPPVGPAGQVPDPWRNGTVARASGEAPAAPVPAKALWHTALADGRSRPGTRTTGNVGSRAPGARGAGARAVDAGATGARENRNRGGRVHGTGSCGAGSHDVGATARVDRSGHGVRTACVADDVRRSAAVPLTAAGRARSVIRGPLPRMASCVAKTGRATTHRGEAPSGQHRGWALQVFQFHTGGRQHHIARQMNRALLPGVQRADLVFVHDQRAIVSGVRFTSRQGPGLVEGAWGQHRVGEGNHADAGRGGIRSEAQQSSGGDDKGRGGTGEGMGAHIAFGGVGATGIRANPGHPVKGGTTYLPARRVEFETDRDGRVRQWPGRRNRRAHLRE